MKIGFSSYSFHKALSTGKMNIPQVIDWIADHGGSHIELATGFGSDDPLADLSSLATNEPLIEAIQERTAARGVEIAQIAMPARMWTPELTEDEAQAQIATVKTYVDLCERLGISILRHDVVSFDKYPGDTSILFDEALPIVAARAKEIAQYAAPKGITTSLENHGYFFQNSERVRRVVRAVDEPNYKTCVDVGNFLCADENPVTAVRANLPYASIVHLKDFYIRKQDPGAGFFTSTGGTYLRGAIVGQGDIDMVAVTQEIVNFGWDGYVSIEFEGMESCLYGCETGLANAKRLLGQD
jgi:3-oxoisoapionate decarboxylase